MIEVVQQDLAERLRAELAADGYAKEEIVALLLDVCQYIRRIKDTRKDGLV